VGVIFLGAVENIHGLAGIVLQMKFNMMPVVQDQKGVQVDFRKAIIQGIQIAAVVFRKRKGLSQSLVKVRGSEDGAAINFDLSHNQGSP